MCPKKKLNNDSFKGNGTFFNCYLKTLHVGKLQEKSYKYNGN